MNALTPRPPRASRSAQLRQMLLSPQLEFLMEAHNGLSARIVREAGFRGIWASGLALSAQFGVRDNNEASWTQVVDTLEFMADASDLPILLDGDTGYGNFNNMRRLVRKLEQRDIAGVCIEDKQFPKTNSFLNGERQPLADIDEFAGKIAAGSQTDIVRSIVGLMVRTGAPAPDIATVDAFKTVLRRTKSISYSKGPSGEYVAELLQRLGLAAEMQDKTIFAVGRFVGEVVANGEAEVGMQQIIESAPVAGAHLVGPLPPELTNYVLYSAGFAANAGNGAAAHQFVAFLASPEAVGIIRSKGMEPG